MIKINFSLFRHTTTTSSDMLGVAISEQLQFLLEIVCEREQEGE